MIVTALSGCDNVDWGGIQFELQPPPPPAGAVAPEAPDSSPTASPPLPQGPVVYLSRRDGDEAALLPVAELRSDTLRPLPESMADVAFARRFVRERTPPGAELALFAQGNRVGTLRVRSEEVSMDSSFCSPRPAVSGTVELIPSATSAERFLALADPSARDRLPSSRTPRTSTYEQRVASIDLAVSLLPQVGATWPPSLVDARRDLRIFELRGSREPAMAATFLHRDRLRTGPSRQGSYSLFFIATHDGTAYRPVYVRYRASDEEGKGAPRYVAHFDWNGDGSDEVLLEVFGESHRWLAVAGTRNGTWETLYEDPCGRTGSGGVSARE